jgi:prepilin-type N-terminal cleavage/methylation domain-containing protein
MHRGRASDGVLARAFTLTELLVVVGILAILLSLLLPNAVSLLNRAQAPLCTSRLRNLWMVFHARVAIDQDPWPQLPTNIRIGSVEEQQWWLTYGSNNLGLTSKDWNCPTISRMVRNSTNSVAQAHLISYLPMLFDDVPQTPMRWLWMPWFTEIANVHGKGAQMVLGDGSVTTADVSAPKGSPLPTQSP